MVTPSHPLPSEPDLAALRFVEELSASASTHWALTIHGNKGFDAIVAAVAELLVAANTGLDAEVLADALTARHVQTAGGCSESHLDEARAIVDAYRASR